MRKILYVLVGLLLSAGVAHADFVTGDTALPSNKTNLSPIPVGADATKYFQASDANSIFGALTALRTAVTTGLYLGLSAQASDPTARTVYPTSNYLWYSSSDSSLHFFNGADNVLSFGGGGISGLTAHVVPVATSASTIGDGPFTVENYTNPVYNRQLLLDGGSTGNIAALHIRPTNAAGQFGAGITLDNVGSDGSGAKQWMLIQLNQGTSYPNWLVLTPGITALANGLLISPAGNVYIHETSGDFLDGTGLTIGANLKFTNGGKIVYAPAVPSNWAGTAPTFLQDAVDRIAAMAATGTLAKP